MGEQLVAGTDPDAVVQPPAQLGLQGENVALLGRAVDRARGRELLAAAGRASAPAGPRAEQQLDDDVAGQRARSG